MKTGKKLQPTRAHRLNEEIKVPEVRLTGEEGEQLGIVTINEALQKAEEAGLDLVELSPNAEPPVCRIMNYGKFLYEKSKAAKEQKKKQKVIQVKEIKFRPGTDDGDYQVKLRSLIRFLEEGDKAKITVRFRGREMAHQEIGMDVLTRVRDDLADISVVESFPTRIEGRQMIMVLAPKKK
ncbi:translation initiation factor IF-3 [Thorsellia kenyensis]|uniref:Translation initiation factor IF-3 n=1 Tax=Thorsellia kenyensis TaxID=1549888 RepID=A0ABV6CBD3_9GAMM